jgi:hypothetical protein
MLIHSTRQAVGWSVAAWLVTHATTYRIHTVRYGGFQWRAASGATGWTRDNDAPAGAAVLAR